MSNFVTEGGQRLVWQPGDFWRRWRFGSGRTIGRRRDGGRLGQGGTGRRRHRGDRRRLQHQRDDGEQRGSRPSGRERGEPPPASGRRRFLAGLGSPRCRLPVLDLLQGSNGLGEPGDGAAGRSPDLDELAPERTSLYLELGQLVPKARRLAPESVEALLGRFHPAMLAQPVLDDLRDDASNHLPALAQPPAHAAEIVDTRPRLLRARRRPASVAWLGRRERHGHAEWAEERPVAARRRRLRVSATFTAEVSSSATASRSRFMRSRSFRSCATSR